MMRLLPLILLGCTGDDTGDTGGDVACADRVQGAEITITITGETFTFWSEDDAFIDEAIDHRDNDTTRVAFFDRVIEGADCDDQWGFHVDDEMEWADLAIELCDGRPSDVDADLDYWIGSVVSWCPWGPDVTTVDDRR